MCALTAVAPIVRFKAFEILATPTFFLASDFNSRTSDKVHARLTIFFLAIAVPFFRTGLVSRHIQLAMSSQLNFWEGRLSLSCSHLSQSLDDPATVFHRASFDIFIVGFGQVT
jgi:hypothetical protein